jgi:hypothetical protein
VIPHRCGNCGAAEVFESCWTDDSGQVHSIWLCATCDEVELKDLVDFWLPSTDRHEDDRDAAPPSPAHG